MSEKHVLDDPGQSGTDQNKNRAENTHGHDDKILYNCSPPQGGDIMNRKIAVLSILGLALFIGAVYALPGTENSYRQRNFVDENGDGICDHYQSGTCPGYGKGFTDENGDGICDHYQSGTCPGYKNGKGFVDENGDGICDKAQSGCGGGCGNRNGRNQKSQGG